MAGAHEQSDGLQSASVSQVVVDVGTSGDSADPDEEARKTALRAQGAAYLEAALKASRAGEDPFNPSKAQVSAGGQEARSPGIREWW